MKQENKREMSKEDYKKYIMMLLNMIENKEELEFIYNCVSMSVNNEHIA